MGLFNFFLLCLIMFLFDCCVFCFCRFFCLFFVCFDVFLYSCYILKNIGYILMYKYVDFSYEIIVGRSLIEYLILIIK